MQVVDRDDEHRLLLLLSLVTLLPLPVNVKSKGAVNVMLLIAVVALAVMAALLTVIERVRAADFITILIEFGEL